MPTISLFFGIIVRMYFMDTRQQALPHPHVEYQGEVSVISIPEGSCWKALYPPRNSGWFKPGLPFMKRN